MYQKISGKKKPPNQKLAGGGRRGLYSPRTILSLRHTITPRPEMTWVNVSLALRGEEVKLAVFPHGINRAKFSFPLHQIG